MVWSVDDRFSLSFYFRIADQLLKQVAVYREEGNLDCLQQTLGRYIRLVSEVIPQHLNYSKHSSKEKLHHKKILKESTKEIEKLKSLARVKSGSGREDLGRSKHNTNDFRSTSQRWTNKILRLSGIKEGKDDCCSSPKTSQSRVAEVTSELAVLKVQSVSKLLILPINMTPYASCRQLVTVFAPTFANFSDSDNEVHVVKHYFPSSVVSWVEDGSYSGQVSHVIISESKNEHSEASFRESFTSNLTQQMHISVKLTEEFLNLAKENTDKDLETCGILGAFLTNDTFYITTLIIPKQESTSNSCQASNEEEILAILEEKSLYPAGWIHTHPSQTCFLSSVDLHTQYSFQVMLPEAIAIVLAPTDPARACGIFRLTDPEGIAVVKECKEKGFHLHPAPADGTPIYETCSNIYTNSNLRFEIIDLRVSS